ncbi:CTQ-dependent glycine oxidase GoxA [Thalassobaculum sp.]|uniref:CTQ-dependent glycine oxidase GoxA n=1 Tax=Thalassobaculum sp. TaxID=2022740 RepID=UPI0032EDDFCA
MPKASNRGSGLKRRDFLAGASALTLTFPLVPKSAVAATGRETAPAGAVVARLGIYPAIGICRVGGSAKWFLAPEVPGLPPQPEGGFKDGEQAIKKQVQRFRIYAFDDQDRVIGEVTAADAKIEWRVHVANTKAAWYGFNNPLDNGALAPGLPGQRRNQYFVTDEERLKMLAIDGGETRIHGPGTNPNGDNPRYAMGGRFWDQIDVGLGHLRTDDAGRLLVFPPDGKSASPTNAPITSFADNNGWHDDWCDGPVEAAVTLGDGTVRIADHAWVASVGPNFAPEIPPISTLYDVIADLNVAEGWTAAPSVPISFRRDIYPTFRRLALMEWVAAEGNLRQGWLNVGDFADPAYIARLRDPSPANRAFRQSVFEKFRDPDNNAPDAYKTERLKMPYMLGDGVNYDGSPLQWFRFPKLQYRHLQLWADGSFTDDYQDPVADAVTGVDDLDLALRPDALTEAALEPCSGGAFHPGVELTYYLRLKEMYARNRDRTAEPFRIALAKRPSLLQDIGFLLTPETAFNGNPDLGTPPPIGPQGPGDLTRWMGLPWQCDAFSCQQVLMQSDFPTAVWWPALLPIDVLPETYYENMMRSDLSDDERLKFFESRVAWSRGVAGIGYHANASYWDGITNMIALWERMGFVVRRPGPGGDGKLAAIPGEVFVEVGRGNMEGRFQWKPSMGDLPN